MPEMTFRVRWPDGTVSDCYSPSLVVHDHLHTDAEYLVSDFVDRAAKALKIASARVEAIYGRPCSLAAAQLREIARLAARFTDDDRPVRVLAMNP